MLKFDRNTINIIFFNAFLGLRAFIKGLDYFRFIEYIIIFELLKKYDIKPGVLLDIGCGEEPLATFLAQKKGFKVSALDLDENKIRIQNKFAKKLNLINNKNSYFSVFQKDASNTGLPDDSVDIVICLALLLLLKEDKDKDVMLEIGRILKPGGIAFISTSYGKIHEILENDITTKGFIRIYDDVAIKQRIVTPSGLNLIDKIFFGDGKIKFSRFWYRLPFILKLPFRWMSPLFSLVFLKYNRTLEKSNGIFLVLQKIN